jgi:hypothetical protein
MMWKKGPWQLSLIGIVNARMRIGIFCEHGKYEYTAVGLGAGTFLKFHLNLIASCMGDKIRKLCYLLITNT